MGSRLRKQMNKYQLFYVVRFKEAVYVLHSFIKRTEQTSKKDVWDME
jgi:phage-related protein